jgi:hypothetical protein
MFDVMLIEVIDFGQFVEKITRTDDLDGNNEKNDLFHEMNIGIFMLSAYLQQSFFMKIL